MEKELLRINILTIAGAGLLMLLTGMLLFPLRAVVGQHIRFLLPIPPLGVAAYVLVFNVFKHHDGAVTADWWVLFREVAIGTAVAALVFGLFTFVLIVLTDLLRRSL